MFYQRGCPQEELDPTMAAKKTANKSKKGKR